MKKNEKWRLTLEKSKGEAKLKKNKYSFACIPNVVKKEVKLKIIKHEFRRVMVPLRSS